MAFLVPAPAFAGTHASGELATLPVHERYKSEAAFAVPKMSEVAPVAETCVPVAAGSPDRRDGAVEACTAVTSVTRERKAAVTQEDGEVCTVSKPGYWKFNRLSTCLREMAVNFTLRGEKQEVLGTATLYVSSSATYSTRTRAWKEEISVEFAEPKGQVQSLNVAADVSCTSLCTATESSPWIGAKKLVDNGVLATGSVAYSSKVEVGKVDFSTTKYHLYITHTGSIPTIPSVNWDNPHQVRCDSRKTGIGSSEGCVDGAVRQEADLEMPISKYGAAAFTYGWVQWNLKDKWGLYSGSPLKYAADGDERRKRTCGKQSSEPFEPFDPSIVKNDSCDEFPFAGTQQGGNDGALCAEIRPHLRIDDKYEMYEAYDDKPVTRNEPCVRSHVPNEENGNAGLEYGRYVQKWRLIDGDPFYLTVPDYFDRAVDAD